MRLLKKQTIDVEKVIQRKREIDEGVLLATRVDALRRTLADEEKNLRTFRETALNEVHLEIEALLKDKEALKREIERNKESIKQLEVTLQPDTNISDIIWAKLSIKSEELEKQRIILDNEEREKQEWKLKLGLEETRILEDKEKARKALYVAELRQKEAEEALKLASDARTEQETTFAKRNQEQFDREASVAIRERELTLEKERVEEDKISITNQRILLIDRERTLDRELKRQHG